MRVAVIGGGGALGKLIAKIFAEEFEVVISDIDEEKGKKIAKELNVEFSPNNIEATRESDIVIISVPIENTCETIKEVAPHVKPGALLTDVTSVKIEPCRAMLRFANREAEIIGMHPMFGPRISSLEGQLILLCPIRTEKWLNFLIKFFENRKAKVHITTPEEHDRIMSVVQGLTHFAYLSVASTIRELGIDVKESRKFSSPIYELMLDMICRITGQNPKLYANIQIHNPFVAKVHDIFIKNSKKLANCIKNKNEGKFVDTMIKNAKHLGHFNVAMGRSDKAIMALTRELRKLKNAIGKEVALKHIYTNKIHVGRVIEVTPDEVILEKKNRKIKLKIYNVEVLSKDFLRKWKEKNLPKIKRDFSVLLPINAEEKVIKELISSEEIVSCEIIDIYKGKTIPNGYKSVTFRVYFFGDVDIKKSEEKVLNLFKSLGYEIR